MHATLGHSFILGQRPKLQCKVSFIRAVWDTKRKKAKHDVSHLPSRQLGIKQCSTGCGQSGFWRLLGSIPHLWGPQQGAACCCVPVPLRSAPAPSSVLSQSTKNANTRAGNEQAMRLLQALAQKKIEERQCSSSSAFLPAPAWICFPEDRRLCWIIPAKR